MKTCEIVRNRDSLFSDESLQQLLQITRYILQMLSLLLSHCDCVSMLAQAGLHLRVSGHSRWLWKTSRDSKSCQILVPHCFPRKQEVYSRQLVAIDFEHFWTILSSKRCGAKYHQPRLSIAQPWSFMQFKSRDNLAFPASLAGCWSCKDTQTYQIHMGIYGNIWEYMRIYENISDYIGI